MNIINLEGGSAEPPEPPLDTAQKRARFGENMADRIIADSIHMHRPY